MPKDIIAFVGPSGSGKTAFMLELLAAMPERLAMCMSITTRQPRGRAEDDAMYRFTSTADFQRRIAHGEFIHWVEHAGNLYGTLRVDADATLRERYAIGAYVEQGVINLRNSGYTVRVVKLRPIGNFLPNVASRKAEDDARDRIDVQPELALTNDFGPGGRARAWEKLFAYVQALP